jgi:hypothetical protein
MHVHYTKQVAFKAEFTGLMCPVTAWRGSGRDQPSVRARDNHGAALHSIPIYRENKRPELWPCHTNFPSGPAGPEENSGTAPARPPFSLMPKMASFPLETPTGLLLFFLPQAPEGGRAGADFDATLVPRLKIFMRDGTSPKPERGHAEDFVSWQGQALIGSWSSARPVTLYAADEIYTTFSYNLTGLIR